jgi:PAS domain S-box-containing protein
LPIPVFGKDVKDDFRWIIWNKAAEELFGLKAENCLGKHDRDFFTEEQVAFFKAKDIEACRQIAPVDIPEEFAVTPKGTLTLRTRKVVLRDREGAPSILLGITEDITESIRLQHQLTEASTKALQKSKLASLGAMSAGVAHEINNPLAIISGTVELLLRDGDASGSLGLKLETIRKSCVRIAKIVRGLRKFSRIDSIPDLKPYVLIEIAQEALVLTQAKAAEHGTTVTLEGTPSALINCDDLEIEQVLINLINNAIDAVDGLPDRWVRVSVLEDKNSVILRVTDAGTGVPEDHRSRLFDPFFTTKHIGKGTGLGLSIVKGILDEHKASISLLRDSAHTCFEIAFPRIDKTGTSIQDVDAASSQ